METHQLTLTLNVFAEAWVKAEARWMGETYADITWLNVYDTTEHGPHSTSLHRKPGG